jgi:hypothetical protein
MVSVVLKDVNVLTKKNQVGQGTLWYRLVGQDKAIEINALKRINTEQEEMGFHCHPRGQDSKGSSPCQHCDPGRRLLLPRCVIRFLCLSGR